MTTIRAPGSVRDTRHELFALPERTYFHRRVATGERGIRGSSIDASAPVKQSLPAMRGVEISAQAGNSLRPSTLEVVYRRGCGGDLAGILTGQANARRRNYVAKWREAAPRRRGCRYQPSAGSGNGAKPRARARRRRRINRCAKSST